MANKGMDLGGSFRNVEGKPVSGMSAMLGPVFAMSGLLEPFSYCSYFINSFCFIFVYSMVGGACTSVCGCVHPRIHMQRPKLDIKCLSPCCLETEIFTEADPPRFCQAAWSASSLDPPSSGPQGWG